MQLHFSANRLFQCRFDNLQLGGTRVKWRGLDESQARLGHATLKSALDERRDLVEKYVPGATRELNQRVVDDLRQSGIADRVLGIGAVLPSFELPDHDGRAVTSSSLLSAGPLVLIFFRGRWCPFCVAQLEAWNALLPEISAAGVTLASASPQTVHQSSLMHDQHRLAFPQLADHRNALARQFGLVYSVPENQRQMYSRAFVNLPFINGDDTWELPVPATYVVGRDARILYALADPDYTVRPEPREVLQMALSG